MLNWVSNQVSTANVTDPMHALKDAAAGSHEVVKWLCHPDRGDDKLTPPEQHGSLDFITDPATLEYLQGLAANTITPSF